MININQIQISTNSSCRRILGQKNSGCESKKVTDLEKTTHKMSVKLKDDKPTASTSIVGCCQSSGTTPDNSIVDYIDDEIDTPNNNVLFHAASELNEHDRIQRNAIDTVINYQNKMDKINFTFPKRPKVDIEFANMKYAVKLFSFKHRRFGM